MERILYPVNEAFERLGVGRSKLYELIADGEIATVKIGRRTLIADADLRAYAERLRDEHSVVAADDEPPAA